MDGGVLQFWPRRSAEPRQDSTLARFAHIVSRRLQRGHTNYTRRDLSAGKEVARAKQSRRLPRLKSTLQGLFLPLARNSTSELDTTSDTAVKEKKRLNFGYFKQTKTFYIFVKFEKRSQLIASGISKLNCLLELTLKVRGEVNLGYSKMMTKLVHRFHPLLWIFNLSIGCLIRKCFGSSTA